MIITNDTLKTIIMITPRAPARLLLERDAAAAAAVCGVYVSGILFV
jgi:hypothetical protein